MKKRIILAKLENLHHAMKDLKEELFEDINEQQKQKLRQFKNEFKDVTKLINKYRKKVIGKKQEIGKKNVS